MTRLPHGSIGSSACRAVSTNPFMSSLSSCTTADIRSTTPVTPYTRPPVSTDLAIRDRLRDLNLPQSTAICRILPSSARTTLYTLPTILYRTLPYSTAFCYILPTYFYYNIYDICNIRNFYRILLSLLNSTRSAKFR